MATTKKSQNQSKTSFSILTDESRVATDIAMMVHQARVRCGMSQSALAKKMGDTKQTSISRLENGKSLPSISFLLRIAVALDSFLIPPKIALLSEVISYRKYLHAETRTKTEVMFSYFFTEKNQQVPAIGNHSVSANKITIPEYVY